MDRNKIGKDFCRRFNRDPKSIPVVGLSYLETISISRSFRPDLTSNRIDSCFRPLLLPQIYPQIYFLSTSLYPLEDFSWQPDNETIVRFETIPTFTQGKVITERCVLIFFVKKKKRKRKEKDRKFLRVEETLEKKESRNLSFKALKSHLPMVASDVKQSTPLSLTLSFPFSLFSVLFSFSNQSSLSPPPATCWRKEDL